MTIDTAIEKIPRIGPAFQRKLKGMGIKTVEDLLFHFPHRYEDFSNIIPISQLKLNQTCCIQGEILEIKNTKTWKRRMILTQAVVKDKSGAIKVIWFNQPYLIKNLKPGDFVCLAGKVSLGDKGVFLSNPAYEKLTTYNLQLTTYNLTHTGRIVPVYPETEGLSSRWFRYILKPLLKEFKNKIPEILPQRIIKTQKLLPRAEAIWQVHFPDSMEMAEKARARFSFEGLFLIELSVLKERLKLNQEKAPVISLNIDLIKKFVRSLPFKLTDAQRKCAWQILKDLEKPRPMSRLLEGDVGSGKTVVAVMAGLNTVKAGWQVGFMAPTEILAKQHFQEVTKLLRPFKIKIALLTGKEDKIMAQKLENEVLEISRQKLLEKTRKGEVNILIGTQTLIQDKVKFAKLGLCIVDEQHRFGVEQRAKLIAGNVGSVSGLCENGQSNISTIQQASERSERAIPHLLSMTATPIPRTLALTIYGDLDLSILDEMPKGRKKIITEVIPPEERDRVYDFIREKVKKGEQIFVICPRIESQKSKVKSQNYNSKFKSNEEVLSWAEAKAVKEEYEKLSKKVFPDLKVGMLHGRMKLKEKEKIMKDFKAKKIDILVSTSVVEVGIDIPQATVMLIEGTERFGLAQLHQFRGRVGRSDLQSYCFLFTDSPAKKTRQRLKAIMKAEDGFELSQKDLEIRGPGSLTGVKQWGIPDLAMENLKNLPLVEKTRTAAKEILTEDPNLRKYPFLKERLKKFEKKIHLE
ncbi:MAG: ATP-dependent DNA helicase RecG [Patescibacteria group bacterium]|nr:ATP-dependent DNA helicase RecG [Patescibacteria group bacterium]